MEIDYKFALADPLHKDFRLVTLIQANIFLKRPGAKNYPTVYSLDGTKALIRIYNDEEEDSCVLSKDIDPTTRDMTEWEPQNEFLTEQK